MKRILTTISLGVLAASSALCQIIAQPQAATSSDTSQGSLGKRYLGASFGVKDRNYDTEYVYGTGLGANVPVTSYLDARVGYSYSWYKFDWEPYSTYESDAHSLNLDFVFYKQIAGGLKPFLSMGVAHVWTSRKFETHETIYTSYYKSPTYTDDYGTWDVTVGIEIPFRWVAFTPTIAYQDETSNLWASPSWSCGLAASSWITPKVGVMVSAAYSEPTDNTYDVHTWTYTVGLRIKF